MEQAQVVRSALLVADLQVTEAIMPAIGALHDSAPRRKALARGWRRGIQAPLWGMHEVAPRLGGNAGFWIIEPLVPAQVLRRQAVTKLVVGPGQAWVGGGNGARW